MKQKFFCSLLQTMSFLFLFVTMQKFAYANGERYDGPGKLPDITITGKIVNSLGEPVRGASVLVKNSTIGASTNEQGEFSVTAPENAILVISFVGYVTQEVSVEGRTSVSVTLASMENTMNEVVVVGYGTQKKKM